jgi:hypothetical protein
VEDDPKVAALKSVLSGSHDWTGYATLAILAGIILELAILFVFAHGISRGEKIALVFANVLIAVGLWVEYVYGGKGADAAAELQRISDARLSVALDRAAAAQGELIKFRAPRRDLMTPENIQLITERLKPFAGTVFDVGHTKVDREQWDFMWRLEPAIRDAGWKQIDWSGGFMFKKNNWPGDHVYGEMGVVDVSIEVRPVSKSKLQPAAEALAAVLNEIGVKTMTDDNNNTSLNDEAIHLIVGPKR